MQTTLYADGIASHSSGNIYLESADASRSTKPMILAN